MNTIADRVFGAARSLGAAAISIVAILGPVQDAYAQSFFSSFWGKLDAHELGTWNALERYEANGIRAIRNLISANSVTLNHRQQGLNHDHSDHLKNAQCKMVQTINGLYKRVGAKNSRKLEYPSALLWRRAFVGELRDFSKNLQGYHLCSDIPQNILSRMYDIAQRYQKKRRYFIDSVENRKSKYRKQQWETAITAEIPGIPFKFEFVNGDLKLTLSRSFAGVKFNGQIGPKSKRSGIKTVRIFTKTKAIFYDIGKKSISFEVPNSTITFDDDTVTILYQ